MDEQTIADRLRQNIPKPYETIISPVVADSTAVGSDAASLDTGLDEMIQYKLHDFFGEQYRDSNEESRQRVQYIYDRVADMLDSKEYGFVIAKIRDLERVIGITHSDNRLYKMYQWLKLENVRRNIDAEMGALTNG